MLLLEKESNLSIAIKPVEDSSGFKLIPIDIFANLFRQKIEFSELKISSDVWTANQTGTIFHGSVEVTGKSMHNLGPELFDDNTSFWIGVRTSSNSKYAISFSCGVSTAKFKFFSGRIDVSKRKFDSLDLATLFEDAIDRFIKESDLAVSRINQLAETKCDKLTGAGMILLATQFGMTFRHSNYVFEKWSEGFDSSEENRNLLYLFKCFEISIEKLGIQDRFEFISNLYPAFRDNLFPILNVKI